MQFLLGVYRDGEQLTSGELIYVHADLAARKSTPWPAALREAVLRYETTPPEQT
jgi:acyl-CoA thioester hydrolase